MVSDNQATKPNKELGIQTILLVEDDEEISAIIVRLLEQETCYKTIAVTDAIQALEVINSMKPNVFILDYRLPGINGLELFDRLHAIKGLESVPTLMYSANSPSRKALQERQITFLAKPFELDKLLQAVEKLIAQQER
jgi:DNA-binding NtrC family response regulator